MKSLIKLSLGFLLISAFVMSSCSEADDNISILEDFNSLTLGSNSYWNGADNSGGFKINGITFPNSYTSGDTLMPWKGFAYSNMHDINTAGADNQYSSYVLNDTNSTNTFVVAYPYTDNSIIFDNLVYDLKLKVTNNTYSALSMKYGDEFTKKFGGADSTESDWFKLTIIGVDENDLHTDTANVYLADYRFSLRTQDFIINEWLSVNLAKLGKVKKLRFELSSSDTIDNVINTPGYFCLDDLEFKTVSQTE